MTVLGREPSPRVLVRGFSPEASQLLAEIFPTTRFVGSITEVDPEDWDALITASGVETQTPNHLFILAFGGPLPAPARRRIKTNAMFPEHGSQLDFLKQILRAEIEVPDDLEPDIRRQALELATHLGSPPYLGIAYTVPGTGWAGSPPSEVRPFVLSRTGYPLAGMYTRAGNKAECWALPSGAADIRWVQLALRYWQARDPVRFPIRADWNRTATWMTQEEITLAHDLERLVLDRDSQLAEANNAIALAEANLSNANAAADVRERLLLTAQGPELVGAVAAALGALGFHVDNLDEMLPDGAPKREDLRVSPPKSKWLAIVEVKGYKDGAKTNDLGKFHRYTDLFVRERHRPPDAKWYVVNQFKNDDPATRPGVLRGSEPDIETFGEAHGVIIDTRDLFRLWQSVARGDLTQAQARQALCAATGLFEYPVIPSTQATTDGPGPTAFAGSSPSSRPAPSSSS